MKQTSDCVGKLNVTDTKVDRFFAAVQIAQPLWHIRSLWGSAADLPLAE